MNPVRIAAFLIATILSGALCAPFDRATGDPMPSAELPAAGGNAATKPRGRVDRFRGFVGVFFSRGTDRLAERVEQAGFPATVNEAMMCSGVAEEAISDYRRDPAPIVLIGHSVGGACAVNFAGRLKTENIPVSLLVTTDPARITADVPLNVERFINIFQSNSLLGGVEIAPAQGFHGHYASYDLTEHAEITHVNMEKTETVQEQLVTRFNNYRRCRNPKARRCRSIMSCRRTPQSSFGTAACRWLLARTVRWQHWRRSTTYRCGQSRRSIGCRRVRR